MSSSGDITRLLGQWAQGDESALSSLMPIVYAELRQIAGGYLRRERSGHTLQPTALVNEAWLRLTRQDQPNLNNRKHFFALSAQIMRQVLVDYARGARAEKRGAGMPKAQLPEAASLATGDLERFLALNEALEQLARVNARQARVIDMRYFGGLNLDEIAELLEVSAATISREQQAAEAWLSHAMSHEV